MTPLIDCPVAWSSALGIVGLAFVTLAAWLAVTACMQQRGVSRIAGAGAGLALLWTVALVRAFAMVARFKSIAGRSLVGLGRMLAFAPVALSVALVVGTGAALVVASVRLRAHLRQRLTTDSVKEALDTLPDAVCFSTAEGRPLLLNTKMDALAHDAFGVAPSDERALWERTCAGEVTAGFEVRDADAARGYALLLAPDGGAWELRRQTLQVEGRPVVEVVATDVTDEFGLAAEVARRNACLERINEQLRAYGADVTRLTREEEVLAAKVRVHDEVGRALVALRAYERQVPEERDRAGLVALWQRMTKLLQTAADADEEPLDAWVLLHQAASAVDVRLERAGELPADARLRELTVALVHECLNNAVRHGGAHEVRVELAHEAGAYLVRIANDGAPPAGPVAETGGLADLRRLVEAAHGTMTLDVEPRFALTACFDQKEG